MSDNNYVINGLRFSADGGLVMISAKRLWFTISLLLGLALLFWAVPLEAQEKPVGKVVTASGIIQAVSIEDELRPLMRKGPIFEGDTIQTGENSRAQIRFTDNSIISLQANSEFKVDEYTFGVADQVDSFTGNLIKGGLRVITGAITKKYPESYIIDTPVATIGIRGTTFRLYYNPVLYGTVEHAGSEAVTVSNAFGTKEFTQGQHFKVDAGNPPERVKELPDVFKAAAYNLRGEKLAEDFRRPYSATLLTEAETEQITIRLADNFNDAFVDSEGGSIFIPALGLVTFGPEFDALIAALAANSNPVVNDILSIFGLTSRIPTDIAEQMTADGV